MLNQKIKISAVSYLNTFPLLYGLNNYNNFIEKVEIEEDIPSVCADKLINNKVDIGLIPVAEIRKIKNPQIISNYCIGAIGKVDTVLLLSDVPINEIKTILLDYHSRTSVNLLKILVKNFWKINVTFIDAKEGFEENIKGNIAGLIIGDRTFSYSKKHKFIYDLPDEWMTFTKLPFVFATWVSNKNIPDDFILEFNNALKFGLKNKQVVIDKFKKQNPKSNINIEDYLNNKISYGLDVEKRRGMELFLKMLRSI